MAKKGKSGKKGKIAPIPILPPHKGKKGIYKHHDPTDVHNPADEELRVAEFSYQNDALAELVVIGWAADTPQKLATYKTDFPHELTNRGIALSQPVVITEDEYYAGYIMTSPTNDEVVFVLPNRTRVNPAASNLLEAAKLLMACTPNGI